MRYIAVTAVLLLAVCPGDVIGGLPHQLSHEERHLLSHQHHAQAGSARKSQGLEDVATGDETRPRSVRSHIGQGLLPGTAVPRDAKNLEEFIVELKTVLEGNRVDKRPINFLFENADFVLSCNGDWFEFGVADGGTLNYAANWRLQHCGPDALVHGFDTFTGLPGDWDIGTMVFQKGAFTRNGSLPAVAPNVVLQKGLFSETLPDFLIEQRAARQEAREEDLGVSYMHVDCDMYIGASQALLMNAPRMHPGTVLVFDELINYKLYRENEIKAMWEWLGATGYHLRVIAGFPPTHPEAHGEVLTLNPPGDLGAPHQSVAFLVTR